MWWPGLLWGKDVLNVLKGEKLRNRGHTTPKERGNV